MPDQKLTGVNNS